MLLYFSVFITRMNKQIQASRIHVVFTWEYAGFNSKYNSIQSCTYPHFLRIRENAVPKHLVFTIVLYSVFLQKTPIIDTVQKMKFSIMDFFIFCAVRYLTGSSVHLWDYTSTRYLFWGNHFEFRISYFSKTYGYGHPEPHLGLYEKLTT